MEPANPQPVDRLDDQIKLGDFTDRSNALKDFVGNWKVQAEAERSMRATFGYWLLAVFFAQVVAVNVAFFLIGAKKLEVEEWTARIFIMAVFTELAAMVFFIVKYLFSREDKAISDILRILYRDKSPPV